MRNAGTCDGGRNNYEMTLDECSAGAAALGLADTAATDLETFDAVRATHEITDFSNDGRISFAEFKFFAEEQSGETLPSQITTFRTFERLGYPRFDLNGDNFLTVREFRIFMDYIELLDEDEEVHPHDYERPSPCFYMVSKAPLSALKTYKLWYNPTGRGECTTMRPCICMTASAPSPPKSDSGGESNTEVIIIAACAALGAMLLLGGVAALVCYKTKAGCFRPNASSSPPVASTHDVSVVTVVGTPQLEKGSTASASA